MKTSVKNQVIFWAIQILLIAAKVFGILKCSWMVIFIPLFLDIGILIVSVVILITVSYYKANKIIKEREGK